MAIDTLSEQDPEHLAAELIAQGDALRAAGRYDEALACYRQLIDQPVPNPVGHFKLGTVFERQRNVLEAEASYRAALAIDPRHADALNNLALLYAGLHRYQEAEQTYRRLLSEQPGYLNAHINLGNLLNDSGRGDEALYHFRRAVELAPAAALPRERLGTLLQSQGRFVEAIDNLTIALEAEPASAVACNNLGACHFILGEHAQAEAAFRRSLEINEDENPAWGNLLLLSNYTSRDAQECFDLHRAFGSKLETELRGKVVRHHSDVSALPRPLRVGLVSHDFRHHSVAYFLLSFLPYLDPEKCHVTAYSTSALVDEITESLGKHMDQWVECAALSDRAVADRISGDDIDVLFDLGGHTRNARLGIFAYRLAPVQVSWIGYPNTTGLDTIDYRLTDDLADPVGKADQFYTEQLWRLPGCFLSYSPPSMAPDVSPPPSAAGGAITFGSFNARVKIGEECIALWAAVLLAVPGSRLLLKSINGVQEPGARKRLIDQFVERGIAAERVQVFPSTLTTAEHLAHYALVDIALDSFPYHGTTTTCEALWMGVPVVTLAGDRHASRVGASLLEHSGFPDWIAHTTGEFVAIAAGLAGDRHALQTLRTRLREAFSESPVLDGRSMAIRFQEAVDSMWMLRQGVDALARDGMAETMPMRLHIGGKERKRGWKILDVEARPEVDFVGDVRNLSGFADQSCNEIYCSHVLEHVAMADMAATLAELHRILVKGGKLLVSVPDLDMLAWLLQNRDYEPATRFMIMKTLFGGQTNEHDFHRIGLNFEFMVDFLKSAGFSEVEQVETFGIFSDDSETRIDGHLISLNLVITK